MRRRRQNPQNLKSFESPLLDGAAECLDADTVLTGTPNIASDTTGALSCWVKLVDSTPTLAEAIISIGDENANSRLQFYSQATTGVLTVLFVNAATAQWATDTDANPFSDNVWIHIALVQGGTSPLLYVNGIAVAQAFTTTTDKTQWFADVAGFDKIRIGCLNFNSNGNNSFTNGNIKDVAFWSAPPTAAQALELYNNAAKLDYKKHSLAANLVTWYTMDNWSWDGTNFTIYDEMGNNNATSVAMEFADMEVDNPY